MAARYMTDVEIDNARQVFQNSLNYDAVILDSHVGAGDRPFTKYSLGQYRIYIGPAFFGCLVGVAWSGAGAKAKKVSDVTVRAWRGGQLKGETETDSKGVYELANLPLGHYDVEFLADGYKKVRANPVHMIPGDVYRIDVVLGKYAAPNGFITFNRRDWPLLMHELTHVWQGQHGVEFFILSGVSCQLPAALTALPFLGGLFPSKESVYNPGTPGKPWKDYNVEQQATIVEKWWTGSLSHTDAWFRYIRDNIRKGKT